MTEQDSSPADSPLQINDAPVVRNLVILNEDSMSRLLNRQVPAWLIGGMIHVVLIASFLIFDHWTDNAQAKARRQPPTSTLLEEKSEEDNEVEAAIIDLGLDSDLAEDVEREKESDFNVKTPNVDGPPGSTDAGTASPTETSTIGKENAVSPTQFSTIGKENEAVNDFGLTAELRGGTSTQGTEQFGAPSVMPGFQGRSGATKEKLLRSSCCGYEGEAAVALALAWLAKQQNPAGYWVFDGTSKDDRIAATGLCVLPFLGAGETHKTGKKYRDNVGRGLTYLKAHLNPNGQFGAAGMYAQAIATIAVCEAAGMTRDPVMKDAARSAIDFIVKAQAADGSWGYTANAEGDTSIVGWQIQALQSARLAGIAVAQRTFDRANIFLESVEIANATETTYGYRGKGGTNALTAVGLLCRQYTGWTPRNPKLANGVDYLSNKFPPREDDFNMYYYYYATQVVHLFGGPKWVRDWNPAMQPILVGKQITSFTPKAKLADFGSWPNENGHIGKACGKLGATALCCLTLEVYYRYLPLYKPDAGGIGALNK